MNNSPHQIGDTVKMSMLFAFDNSQKIEGGDYTRVLGSYIITIKGAKSFFLRRTKSTYRYLRSINVSLIGAFDDLEWVGNSDKFEIAHIVLIEKKIKFYE